ncbi:MAG TPA: Gfo/Idh/MocA family oxidoreductase [Candidatus Hydrogenedentes bacterium]|nr:Gfo/Idh/MocA family oxidoreductase [Candidatus Hydrogenedentota bacterium]HPG65439.1 Gfo/Idh/MocA family oxidoreductase [Candidatus Hydrogenedentota bacterium]
MSGISRRQFIKRSMLTGVAFGATAFSLNALGANERIVLGVMGLKGRGSYLTEEFAKRDDVEVRYLADPDSRLFAERAKTVEGITGAAPQCVQDFRRILDDPEVDGVVMGTPDHWHALGTVLACQAGKDVYVEKPTSHNIWESRKMIEAARKYKRVVQVGAQNRSAEYCYKAFEYLRSEAFGDIHFVRVLNSKSRGTIGFQPDKETPEGVDYDMWLGPAPMRPFNENHFHYAWHWFWAYSGGDIINDGVHQMDIARWLIDRKYPKRVTSAGGILYFNDDQETPDTHTVNYEFDGITMAFEQILWAPYLKKTPMAMRDTDTLPTWPFSGTRIEVYGTRQMMFLGRHGGGWEAFDADGKSVAIEHGRFTESNAAHQQNFIDCIRSRELPSGDIEKLHYSTLLCHYGNIAYRVGRVVHIDPNTEGFVDDDEANALVKRTYREPYVVPENV